MGVGLLPFGGHCTRAGGISLSTVAFDAAAAMISACRTGRRRSAGRSFRRVVGVGGFHLRFLAGKGPNPMAEEGKQTSLVTPRLSAMMFLEFFIWGGWYVTVGNYMAAHGMGGAIAWAYSMCPIAAILSPFTLGMIADRFFPTERVLGVLHIVGGAALFCAPFAAGAGAVPFLLLVLVHTLCYMPTLGLTNSLAFHNLTNQEKQFPIIRVFGTVGWIVAGIFVSKLLHADETPLPLHIAGAAAVLMGLYSFTLPHTPPPAKGKAIAVRDILGLDSLVMLKDKNYLVFIVSSLLICVPLAVYYAFAPVFVNAAGFADPGFNMSFGQMSEVFFMLIMPLCFARLGVKWMLGVGMLAWVLRYLLFAVGAPDSVTWMILGGILLHGICYDFFFVTGFIYCDKKASVKIRSQAQGFLVLVTQGIGMLAGAQIGGLIQKAIVKASLPAEYAKTPLAEIPKDVLAAWQADVLPQWQTFWIIPCIAAGVVMLAFLLLFKSHAPKAEAEPAAPAAEPAQEASAGE
jgi:nucleoside transporter